MDYGILTNIINWVVLIIIVSFIVILRKKIERGFKVFEEFVEEKMIRWGWIHGNFPVIIGWFHPSLNTFKLDAPKVEYKKTPIPAPSNKQKDDGLQAAAIIKDMNEWMKKREELNKPRDNDWYIGIYRPEKPIKNCCVKFNGVKLDWDKNERTRLIKEGEVAYIPTLNSTKPVRVQIWDGKKILLNLKFDDLASMKESDFINA
jgi:hypothetical protein